MEGSKWDEVLDGLTKHFELELREITRKEIIKFCIENKTTRKAAEDFLKRYKKSNQKDSARALEKKEEGNCEYRKRKFKESLLLYTESIFSANKDDECLPLAYSNRAVVLQQMGHPSESLVDIDMALDSGYPKAKTGKLIMMKVKALAEIGESEKASDVLEKFLEKNDNKEFCNKLKNEMIKNRNVKNKHNLKAKPSLPQLTGGENENFVSASKHLSVHFDESRGRHVVATKDIEIGDVLFVEKPFAHISFDKSCHNCLKITYAPLPCWNCSDVSYCSPECRDEFWKCVHSFECSFAELFKSVGIAHLSLRIILNASSSLDELKKISENIPPPEYKNGIVLYKSKEYDSVYNLVHNSDKYETIDLFQYGMTALLLALYMESNTSYFPTVHDDKDLEFLTLSIWLHIMQLVCNGHAVTRVLTKGSEEKQIVDEREVRCGTSIYTSASMMNHSCEPSIINNFNGKWLVVRAIKPIKKGEEVFNCYGTHARRMSRADRREVLRKQYFFHCECEACLRSHDVQDIFTAFKCTACKGPSVRKGENSVDAICLDCGSTSNISAELSDKRNQFYALIKEVIMLMKSKGKTR